MTCSVSILKTLSENVTRRFFGICDFDDVVAETLQQYRSAYDKQFSEGEMSERQIVMLMASLVMMSGLLRKLLCELESRHRFTTKERAKGWSILSDLGGHKSRPWAYGTIFKGSIKIYALLMTIEKSYLLHDLSKETKTRTSRWQTETGRGR